MSFRGADAWMGAPLTVTAQFEYHMILHTYPFGHGIFRVAFHNEIQQFSISRNGRPCLNTVY